jgi:hypothetical protein
MAMETRERRIDYKDFLYLVTPVCPAGHAEVSLDLGREDLADVIEKNGGLQCPVCRAEAPAEVAESVRQFATWVQRIGAPGHRVSGGRTHASESEKRPRRA